MWRAKTIQNANLPKLVADPDFETVVDWALGLDRLEQIFLHVHQNDARKPVSQRVLEALNTSVKAVPVYLDRIPEKGPLVIVANHPFGVVDGMALLQAMKQIRSDVKIMITTSLRGLILDTEDLIFVDNNGSSSEFSDNRAGLTQALRWLKKDHGALIVFPAGAVSRYHEATKEIRDLAWEASVAGLIQKSEASVLPAFIEGKNSWLFYQLGRRWPSLYPAQLLRELVNKRNKEIGIKFGPIIPKALTEKMDKDKLIEALRENVYQLESCKDPFDKFGCPTPEPLLSPIPKEILEAEFNRIRGNADRILYRSSTGIEVVLINGNESDPILQEIGRLRESVFRPLGEGTGKSRDLDQYDLQYRHLVLWKPDTKEIIGAYRAFGSDMGRLDDLYTSQFMKFSEAELKARPRLELGRAFVVPEYAGALELLWKGIGSFLAQHPRYRHLIGCVSMSKNFSPYSHHLVVQFLRNSRLLNGASVISQLNERYQLPSPPFSQSFLELANGVESVRGLQRLIDEIENSRSAQHPPFPQLIRHYGELLGGNVLGFTLDAEFGSIDVIYEVNIDQIRPRVLAQFMGEDAAEAFRASRPQ